MHLTLELLRRSRAYYNFLNYYGPNCEDIEICNIKISSGFVL